MRRVCALVIVTFAFTASNSPAQDTAKSALEQDSSGWSDLLADGGADMKGWSRVSIPPTGTLSANSPWSFDSKTSVLTCAGDASGHEWLRFDKELDDGILHVEWRFVPMEGKKGYNSGIYARNSADGKTWHQAQTGDASGGFLFGESPRGGENKFQKPAVTKPAKVAPAGEWNVFELTCKADAMSLFVNGAETCRWEKLEAAKGFVGLEAEGYRIEFRNVKYKPLQR
jgi:hypothetical protein